MTKRIFKSICLVGITVFLACLVIIMGVLYRSFAQLQQNDLKTHVSLASHGAEIAGMEYFINLNPEDYRITWIDANGIVVYDSEANIADMDNHGDREEVKSAYESGYGESSRYSSTLLQRQLYSAQRLSNGTVLRISSIQNTILAFLLEMFLPILFLAIVAVVLSLILASRLSKQIVKPLNSLNLDEPLSNENYEELAPLLRRIEHQHRQIDTQMSKLKHKQHEFEAITASMNEGLILLNDKGLILSINKSAAQLFHTDKSSIGQDILTINRNFALQELLKMVHKGKKVEKVIELDGGMYQLVASPVFSNGENNGVALLIFNVTERINAEQNRREFTANVSHELKTPLHSISGCAELLKNGLVKSEDMPQFFEQIYFEAQRMTQLVDGIIRLSYLDEGAEGMTREQVDLMSLAEEVIYSLQPTAKEFAISLNLQGDNALVNGFPQLLSGIVFNLCDNAIKYNHQGGHVDVSIVDEEKAVLLSVSDTGIGIPDLYQSRIFERFYRVNKSHPKEIDGSGLGLSIVKHAVRLHDGNIEINSKEGKGTTIIVNFPK